MIVENLLFEYDAICHDKLKAYIYHDSALDDYFSIKRDVIKPKNYCGILHAVGEDFFILPKISKENHNNLNIFIYMLMFSCDIKLRQEDIASLQNQPHKILEIFIQLFTDALLKELRSGLFKQYVTYAENLQLLRGKYLINENLKHNFTKQKIYCEFDEFSPDNGLNQFFLYAIRVFMRHTKSQKSLKMCEAVLDEVAYRHIDINRLDIKFDRLNVRYKKSFDIAIMILRHYIPLFAKDKQSFAFLFDMNLLFENFVAKLIPHARVQRTQNFGKLCLTPDIMIDNLIIDTKYKMYKDRKDLQRTDKYQMFVYGRNFAVKNTMLLYPEHLEKGVSDDLVLGEGDECVKLAIRSLDLDFDGGYEAYVEEMRKRVEEVIWKS